MAEFSDVFSSLSDVNGWMTHDQAQRLWNRAGELPAGATVVEIGSFQGRSMCVLASSAREATRFSRWAIWASNSACAARSAIPGASAFARSRNVGDAWVDAV